MEMWHELDLMGKILTMAMMLNVVMAAGGKMLDLIKDKTSSKVDNKIAALLHKISSWASKIVDWLSANRQH